MGISCTFGFHSWEGCKCSKCGKTKDEGHDWRKDCEKCSKCGATRTNAHQWDGCKCKACGKTRDEGHDCSKDYDKFATCGEELAATSTKTYGQKAAQNTERSNIETVKVGNQEWMSSNLNVRRFRNGDPIPEAKTDEEWEKAGSECKPAWCYYESNSENCKLYNLYAVKDNRGLIPEGWHIPTETDLKTLAATLNKTGNPIRSSLIIFYAMKHGNRRADGYFEDDTIEFWGYKNKRYCQFYCVKFS